MKAKDQRKVRRCVPTGGCSVPPCRAAPFFVGTKTGTLTNFKFACAAYGTSAPVTIAVIYRR